ncbi:MAG: DegT/DnrJ/EryC1/StrS aminotransferase family protein [Syntrophales bacterium]|nr:DegT/DnrJ/EryC1/StrS aminotransferase family protein [Syntrophales bacterium]
MEFVDLKKQRERIKTRIVQNIERVMSHGRYIMGPEVVELEERLASFVEVEHAVGCSSGTDALLLALMALSVGPGDAVFTTPFTFVATAEAIKLVGATPVFVDIDPRTYNIDAEKLERAIIALSRQDLSFYPLPRNARYLKPRAVIPVDLFGLPADYEAIEEVAKRYGLYVIEDAAQSFGAEYKGRKTCSFGQIACTSFYPAKPLGGYGDGGMCFTDDDELAGVLRSLRDHGQGSRRYEYIRLGINGRLDTIQAAILLAKWEIFPEEFQLRQEVAARYRSLLGSNKTLVLPEVPEGLKSAWAQFSVLATDENTRRVQMENLSRAGVPTVIYYPKPLHLQCVFSELGYNDGDFPFSEDCAKRIFSLPMHPYLTLEEQLKIADVLSGTVY